MLKDLRNYFKKLIDEYDFKGYEKCLEYENKEIIDNEEEIIKRLKVLINDGFRLYNNKEYNLNEDDVVRRGDNGIKAKYYLNKFGYEMNCYVILNPLEKMKNDSLSRDLIVILPIKEKRKRIRK